MSDIFPRWTNKLPARILAGALLVGTAAVSGVWYYSYAEATPASATSPSSPLPTRMPPMDQLGMDCRYCHSAVEKSWYANIPSAASCMNCHNQVLATDPRLALVRESAQSGKPIPWVQIHKTPDYVYFNHAVHVNRGVSCFECHGPINKMEEVRHAHPSACLLPRLPSGSRGPAASA